MTPLEVLEAVFPTGELVDEGWADAWCQISRDDYARRAHHEQWTWWDDRYISYTDYLTGEVA